MTVLVTGASGFIGRELSRYLTKVWPHEKIVGIARRGKGGIVPNLRCDLQNWEDTQALIHKIRPTLIFHCAGTTLSGPWPLLNDNHVIATANLLEACNEMIPKPRVVILGSAAEYGSVPASRQPIHEKEIPRPLSPYGISKYDQTLLSRAFSYQGLAVVVGRIFNILAPDLPPHFSAGRFAFLIQKARHHKLGIQTVGSLEGVRDFVSIRDVCRALAALGRRGHSGEIYNVCSGVPVRMRDLFREMTRAAGVHFPIRESKSHASARTFVQRCVGSPLKIRRHTGWRPKDHWKQVLREWTYA